MWIWVAGCAALDREGPDLDVAAPTGPVSGSARLEIDAGDAAITVSVDGGPPAPLPGSGSHDLPLDGLSDGLHTVTVTATARSMFGGSSVAHVVLAVDQTPPILDVSDSSRAAAQGRTFAVWMRASEPVAEARVAFAERDLPMFEVDGAWRSLVGVAIRHEPGPAPLVVTARDRAGNEGRLEVEIDVAETAFEVGGFIRLSRKQTEARKDTEAIAKMRAERDGAYAVDAPEQLWNGPLGLPVYKARRTSPFGKYRTYSDGRKSYHTGLDLSRRRGAPVAAAEDGVVVIAHEQAILGNVVMLDHGHGVTTSYNHLDRIDVQEGQLVKRGEQVGLLGSTGQSTGPHLHWSLVVGREAVDPSQWLAEDFSTSPFPGEPEW